VSVAVTNKTPRVRGRGDRPIRVLYSFGLKLGGGRVNGIAWQQINGLANAGADVLAYPGVNGTPLPPQVRIRPTLARGKFRISYKLVGRLRAYAWHDYVVSRRLERLAGNVDIVHTWPMGSLRTLRTAAELGIPTVYERPNAHTQFAYEVVQEECERLGVSMPSQHEHTFNNDVLLIEYEEYRLASRLLCPSDFVMQTFIERGFPPKKLARHQYGFDQNLFYSNGQPQTANRGLTMLFVGGCAPRKGLHFALEAWLKSPAHHDGTFLIVGEFIPGYAEKLAPMLSAPSVRVLGQRTDVGDLMRKSDLFVLPSLEEGSALVTYEARGSGCVLLVSDASGAVCKHMENALVHHVADVAALTNHITMLHNDRELLANLRSASISTAHHITWKAAGRRLLEVYEEVIRDSSRLSYSAKKPFGVADL